VLVISSPPYSLAFLAAQLVGELDIPVYLDLRDPWTINPYKIYPTSLHRRLDQKREIRAISKIHHLISAYRSTLNDYDERIENFYSRNILLLPNGYDPDDFIELGKSDEVKTSGFNIGFSGTVYSHLNTPYQVFAAIKELKQQKYDVHFHHIGTSAFDLMDLAEKFGIEDQVHLWGYRPHRESLKILNTMDALCLMLDDRISNAEMTIGGKFYEYLRLKIPIFAIVPEEGEAAQLIRITRSGISVSAKDLDKIVQTLKILIRQDFSFSWDGIQKYDRYHQARVLASFLEKTS
jgi:glycosyltransferase involved in cell wall biosynthesis